MKYKFSRQGYTWLMRGLILHILLFFSVLSFANVFTTTGQGLLQRKISLRVENLDVKEVLKIIESRDTVRFAYQSQAVNMNRRISLDVEDTPLLNVLGMIFDSNYEFDEFGHFVVIKAGSVEAGILTIVRGTVKDQKTGELLPGVNVMIKGTTQGTVTDVDGKFSLPVGDNAVLVFSFVGYKTQEISVGGRTTVDVELASEAKILDELVVIGYGEQSKKTLATAISKVSGDDIGTQIVSNPGDALSGLTSGVQVQSTAGGAPGAPPNIRVRGPGTIGGSADVLYVVDGYPLQDADNFNQINPADIESIEILKDAASAAIYGSRAANGVVLVKTKRGKAGKTSFDFSMYQGYQNVGKRYDMMNRDEYIATVKQGSDIQAFLNKTTAVYPAIFDIPNLPDTDWQSLIYRTGKIRNMEISASGGNEKIKFRLSGGNFSQAGVLRGTSYDRYTLRFNMDAELSSRLRVGVSLAPSYSDQYRLPARGQYGNSSDGNIGRSLPNVVQCAIVSTPLVPAYLPNGDYGTTRNSGLAAINTSALNPLATIENVTNRYQNYSFLGKTFLDYDILRNLTFRSTIAATYTQINQNGYVPPNVPTNDASQANNSTPVLNNTWAIERNNFALDWLWENMITCKLNFGPDKNHHLTVLGLGSMQRNNFKQVSTNGKVGSYFNSVIENPGSSSDLQGGISYNSNAFVSIGGRINYDWKNRYIIAAAVRQDGSSKFGPNRRFAAFPSISAAWRMVEEGFMDGLQGIISDLKFRASYGQTGNANIGSFNWANGVVSRNYVIGGVRYSGGALSGFANDDLTWEKNSQFNYGADVGLLKNKVTFSVDYYVRTTTDMLLNQELSGLIGYSRNARINVGEVVNKGLEFNVSTNLKIKKAGWIANYNFSSNKSEVTDLGGPTSLPYQNSVYGWSNTAQVRVGEPLGNFYGFIVDGIFRNQEDLDKYPQWEGNKNAIGDWRIRDMNNKDGRITEEDRTVLGNGIPRFYFGSTQRFTYSGFDLTVIVQGVGNVSVLNGNVRQLMTGLGPTNLNLPRNVVDNFFDPRKPDADVKWPMPGRASLGSGPVSPVNQATSPAVEDASFVRVKNITLGYSFPKEILERLRIKGARIYISGQNLFTFTRYTGQNPEASVVGADSASNTDSGQVGSSNVQSGIDQGTYPTIRVITCGFNFSF